jgi:hypothetical protein
MPPFALTGSPIPVAMCTAARPWAQASSSRPGLGGGLCTDGGIPGAQLVLPQPVEHGYRTIRAVQRRRDVGLEQVGVGRGLERFDLSPVVAGPGGQFGGFDQDGARTGGIDEHLRHPRQDQRTAAAPRVLGGCADLRRALGERPAGLEVARVGGEEGLRPDQRRRGGRMCRGDLVRPAPRLDTPPAEGPGEGEIGDDRGGHVHVVARGRGVGEDRAHRSLVPLHPRQSAFIGPRQPALALRATSPTQPASPVCARAPAA